MSCPDSTAAPNAMRSESSKYSAMSSFSSTNTLVCTRSLPSFSRTSSRNTSLTSPYARAKHVSHSKVKRVNKEKLPPPPPPPPPTHTHTYIYCQKFIQIEFQLENNKTFAGLNIFEEVLNNSAKIQDNLIQKLKKISCVCVWGGGGRANNHASNGPQPAAVISAKLQITRT